MYIHRELKDLIDAYYADGMLSRRAAVIYGPRQVGKTTLSKQFIAENQVPSKVAFYNCDQFEVRRLFAYENGHRFADIVSGLDLLVLDEAQRIENIGLVLKILVDSFPNLKIIATGSSSFDLSNQINEPMTGRKFEFLLLPFSFNELKSNQTLNKIEERALLERMLVFGSYPIVGLSPSRAAPAYLSELVDSYLYKDIFNFQTLRYPAVLNDLLRLLAFQIGSDVSINELATQLGIDRESVNRYLYLLEEAFVIFRLPSFSRNLRKTITKNRKIYFYDLGVRNTIIGNLNPIDQRQDVGQLWENYCIVERFKHNILNENRAERYFWRDYNHKEIDYLEVKGNQIITFEFKWSPSKKGKIPSRFRESYPDATYKVIHRDNFKAFIQTQHELPDLTADD